MANDANRIEIVYANFSAFKGEQITAGECLRIDYFAYTLIPACQHT